MAIDSKEKRNAIFGIGRPWNRNKLPIATPDLEWRASSGITYAPYGLTGTPAIVHTANWSSDYNHFLEILR